MVEEPVMKPDSEREDSATRQVKVRLIGAISIGLLIWATIIGWGIVRNQAEFDVRKPLIMLGVIVGFVAVWLGLMFSRRAK